MKIHIASRSPGFIKIRYGEIVKMHELQVTERILDIILRHAESNQVTKVVSIKLKVGELSDLEDEWIQNYFDYLTKDTIAADAKLNIERAPVVMECDECGDSFQVNIKEIEDIKCPNCGSEKCTLISGKEYHIVDMEVM